MVKKRAGAITLGIGDGANDAAALREADVGISVDTAVDLARESADCILLDKDLGVLWEGVREGRRVFVNVLKYLRLGASSNFGNMLSMALASLVIPFLPMTAIQIQIAGWGSTPATSSAAARTTAGVTSWRSSAKAPSRARSAMMLMSRGRPPLRRCNSARAESLKISRVAPATRRR